MPLYWYTCVLLKPHEFVDWVISRLALNELIANRWCSWAVVAVQVLLVGLYLLLCVLYWAWSGLQLVAELRDVLDVKHFINNKLGISDRQVGCRIQAVCCM